MVSFGGVVQLTKEREIGYKKLWGDGVEFMKTMSPRRLEKKRLHMCKVRKQQPPMFSGLVEHARGARMRGAWLLV